MWSLIYYQSANGRCPVKEYLDNLGAKEAAKVTFDLDLLESLGLNLGAPYIKNIRSKLWELRTTGRTQHRVFYFAITGKRLVLLHAFTKKTPKTPVSEINIALKRMKDFERTDK